MACRRHGHGKPAHPAGDGEQFLVRLPSGRLVEYTKCLSRLQRWSPTSTGCRGRGARVRCWYLVRSNIVLWPSRLGVLPGSYHQLMIASWPPTYPVPGLVLRRRRISRRPGAGAQPGRGGLQALPRASAGWRHGPQVATGRS
jgi:hypothetical protein